MCNRHRRSNNRISHPVKRNTGEKTSTASYAHTFNPIYAIRMHVLTNLASRIKLQASWYPYPEPASGTFSFPFPARSDSIFSKLRRYSFQLFAPSEPIKTGRNSITAKLAVQGKNAILLIKINNAPILKIGIFPSLKRGDFTLLELWIRSPDSEMLGVCHDLTAAG